MVDKLSVSLLGWKVDERFSGVRVLKRRAVVVCETIISAPSFADPKRIDKI